MSPLPPIQDAGCQLRKEDIADFERQLGVCLPESYRRFLLKQNGGRFADHVMWSEGDDEYWDGPIQEFLGLNMDVDSSDIRVIIEAIQGPVENRRGERMPVAVIPIAGFAGGYVCLGISGEMRGHVYEWYGEYEDEGCSLIAESFEAFIEVLEVAPEQTMPEETMPAFRMVELGDLKGLSELLDSGKEVEQRNQDNFTLLIKACYQDHFPVARLLIERGADARACTSEGWTPLHLTSSADIARLLLEHGADPNAKDSQGRTPLMKAAEYSSIATARVLLQCGADVHAKAEDGRTVFSICQQSDRDGRFRRLLLEMGAGNGDEKTRYVPESPTAAERLEQAIEEFKRASGMTGDD